MLLTGIPKLSLKDNRAFGVLDQRGEAPKIYSSGSELGFYFNDTRYLSVFETTLNGRSPIALAHELRYGGNTLVISMTNHDLEDIETGERIPRDTLLIRRILTLHEDAVFETIAIRNFDNRPHTVEIEQWIGSRFDDIFEVRGYPRPKRGSFIDASEHPGPRGSRITVLGYEGLDRKLRRTFVHRFHESKRLGGSQTFEGSASRVAIPPKEDAILKTIISFDEPHSGKIKEHDFATINIPQLTDILRESRHSPLFSGLRIETDNAIVNRAIENAKIDIRMLLTVECESLLYPCAGVPWFSAPFGRDGIITAYQLLPWHPQLAHGVLEYVFKTLGDKVDDFTDEQPGKVFHEMRRGEMSNTRELPFIPYYGSVDSTPLSLILLHEYISWTMDLENLRKWWPAALRALDWVEKWGDCDHDGFLEYAKASPTGLVNQGWKDSHDSIMHVDGTLARAPIRLAEVQGYAFRARMAMSVLAKIMGNATLSSRLRFDALQLKARFAQHYWDASNRFIYLALDGDGQPCKVRSPNMGHCLSAQLVSPEQARNVVDHLMSPAMFSGYGVRTLADTEIAYNPLSYHNGSVWPHDNSLIMEGFRAYGHTRELQTLATALIEVLETSKDFRLPELFCGFRKRGQEPPVPYAVACKPQAWAAGSVFLMLKSMLGLSIDTDQSHLVFRSPILTPKIGFLKIQGLHGRNWELDLACRRTNYGTHVEITRKSGNVRVLTVR